MASQEAGNAVVPARPDEPQFGERTADEVAFGCARMGQNEVCLVQPQAVEVDEVEIDRARAVAHGAHASERVLDRVHPPRERMHVERGREDGRLVQEQPLGERGRDVDRLRFADGARPDETRRRQRRERGECTAEVLRARLDVRPKRDDRPTLGRAVQGYSPSFAIISRPVATIRLSIRVLIWLTKLREMPNFFATAPMSSPSIA